MPDYVPKPMRHGDENPRPLEPLEQRLASLQLSHSMESLRDTALTMPAWAAIMCGLFAHNNGYSKRLWTALGFLCGIWAVAILILLPKRARPN